MAGGAFFCADRRRRSSPADPDHADSRRRSVFLRERLEHEEPGTGRDRRPTETKRLGKRGARPVLAVIGGDGHDAGSVDRMHSPVAGLERERRAGLVAKLHGINGHGFGSSSPLGGVPSFSENAKRKEIL